MHKRRGTFRSNDAADYDDFSNFGWDEQFDVYSGNADFVEEYDEDEELSQTHQFKHTVRKTLQFVAGVLIALFLAFAGFLLWFNSSEPGTYVPIKNQQVVAEVLMRRTQSNHPQLYVEVRFLGSGNQLQTVCGLIKGDTFNLRVDWIDLVNNEINGFRWADVNGQLSVANCHQPNTTQTCPQGTATLGGGDAFPFNIIHSIRFWWLFGLTTQPFTKTVGSNTSPQMYKLSLSANGNLTSQKIDHFDGCQNFNE